MKIYGKVIKICRNFIILFFMYTNSTLSSLQFIDRIVAIVNNNIILESDISNILATLKQDARRDKQFYSLLHFKILDQLIIDNILMQKAKRYNISVSNEELNQTINNILTSNHINIDQLSNRFNFNNKNYYNYRAQICKEILINKVINIAVNNRIIIFPKEIESVMKQTSAKINNDTEFDLSYILVSLSNKSTKNQIHKANNLASLLVKLSKHGADFSKLVIDYSKKLQYLKNIKREWVKLRDLPSFFATYLQGTQKGSVIGPISYKNNIYILKVNDIRENNNKTDTFEVHVRHILLRPSTTTTELQLKTKLKDIITKINNGKISFNIAAQKISEDYTTASKGGDLGWKKIYNFEPVLRSVIINLKKNQISFPVRSSLGWHLIKLVDTRRIYCNTTLNKEKAYQLIFNRKFMEEMQNWIHEQRAYAYIKIF